MNACAAAKQLPPKGWTKPAESVESVFSPTTRALGTSTSPLPPATVSKTFTLNHHVATVEPILMSLTDLGARHSIGAPIHVYPLYENGFRAHRNQSVQDNHRESARLYADFSRIAAGNEYAWGHGKAETEETIGKSEGRNRMICFPCMHSPELVSKCCRGIDNTNRSTADECIQHRQPCRCCTADLHRLRRKARYPTREVDLSSCRCRNTR